MHNDARIRVGERLSQARQAKEISFTDASERLRIRRTYLEALESGDWSTLPEEVYVMGFLRQYATLLGVDISQDIDALKTGDYKLTKPFTMPDPPIAMNRTWALAAGACFFLVLILFNVVDEGEKNLAPPATIADLPLASVPAPDMPPVQQTAAEKTELSQNAPSAKEAVTPPAPVQEKSESIPSAEPEQHLATEHAASAAGGTAHRYQLTAVEQDVWLQVHAPDGSLLKEALLRSGQSLRLNTDVEYVLLTAGNPLALSVSIDGTVVAEAGSLGELDKVLHDYQLQAPATPAASED
jgi:cytoskeletal protein RodZ